MFLQDKKTQTDEQTKTDAQENDKEEDCKEEYDTAELKRKSEEKVNQNTSDTYT